MGHCVCLVGLPSNGQELHLRRFQLDKAQYLHWVNATSNVGKSRMHMWGQSWMKTWFQLAEHLQESKCTKDFFFSIPFIHALGPGWLNYITQVLTGNSCIVFQCDRLLSGTTWRSMTRHLHWHLCLPLSSRATQVVQTWLALVNDTLDVGWTTHSKKTRASWHPFFHLGAGSIGICRKPKALWFGSWIHHFHWGQLNSGMLHTPFFSADAASGSQSPSRLKNRTTWVDNN